MKAIQHLVNVSGGKDSTATYLLAMESGRPFRAVFADTGNEHPLTLEYVATLHEKTGGPRVEVVRAEFSRELAGHKEYIQANWEDELVAGRPGVWLWKGDDEVEPGNEPPRPVNPFISRREGDWKWRIEVPPLSHQEARAVVAEAVTLHEPTGNPYLDLCISKGRFPSSQAQFCTDELKVVPITLKVVCPMLKQGPVLQWLGIRAEESRRRAKQPRFNRHETGAYLWRPIFRWKLDEVWGIHRRHGIAPNPLYALGFDRVGCYPCINCSKNEVRLISNLSPEHIDRIERWERIVARAAKRGLATFFPALTDPTDSDTPGVYSGIRKIVDWSRTERGGRKYSLFWNQQAGGGCNSDLGVCET